MRKKFGQKKAEGSEGYMHEVKKELCMALAGNPNTGKSTVFVGSVIGYSLN